MLAASMHHNVLSKRAFLTLRAEKRERIRPLSACQAGAYHYCICFSVHAYAQTGTSARAQFLDLYPRLLPYVCTRSACA